jgi:hypothetical protein
MVKERKKYPRNKDITPTSFYLGRTEERKRRSIALGRIAKLLGLTGRSQLLQKIADGEMFVSPIGDTETRRRLLEKVPEIEAGRDEGRE